jgi:hypothetical protein
MASTPPTSETLTGVSTGPMFYPDKGPTENDWLDDNLIHARERLKALREGHALGLSGDLHQFGYRPRAEDMRSWSPAYKAMAINEQLRQHRLRAAELEVERLIKLSLLPGPLRHFWR